MPDFISEDDLDTFEGWLKQRVTQAVQSGEAAVGQWRPHIEGEWS